MQTSHRTLFKTPVSIASLFVRLVDVLLFFLASYSAYSLHLDPAFHNPVHYWQVSILGAALLIFSNQLLGTYRGLRGKPILYNLAKLCLSTGFMLAGVLTIVFFTHSGLQYSRIWFGLLVVFTVGYLSVFRILMLLVLRQLRKKGYSQKNIIIIGTGQLGQTLAERINSSAWEGYKLINFWSAPDEAHHKTDSNNSTVLVNTPVKPIPDLHKLAKIFQQEKIVEVWIALPLSSQRELKTILANLDQQIIKVRYFPDLFEFGLINHSVQELLGLPSIDIKSTPMVGLNRLVKALEDKVIASCILILISPLMLLIACAVKFSSRGPVFYKQERLGWNGKPFNMLKFRSMPVDVEKNSGAVWAKAGENRATKVGAFLRRTSLDELPQFINVLKGDMSIVGPRPERPVFVEDFKKNIPGYMQKHLVKAGITGWAQINGWRGNTCLNKRIEFDLFYINHWSLLFDLKIIALTIFKGFLNKNAY